MEEKTLRFASASMAVLAVLVCALFPWLPKLHTWQIERQEQILAEAEYAQSQTQMNDLEIREGGGMNGGVTRLKIRLPEGVTGDLVAVSNDYVTQTVQVEIPGTDEYYFDSYPISGSSSHIATLSYAMNNTGGVIEIGMDQVYEIETEYDSEYYYFDFLTPQEVYDKVVVIDAGHGGRVPGATRQGVNEKDIDLAIVLQLREIFEENGGNIGVYYTRTDDSNPTFEQRVQLANKSGADLFISVHNNSTRSGRLSFVRGTQVMYSETSEESRRFAGICLDEVVRQLGSRDKGLVEGDSIYIIRTSEVPVALIEVGFMTNREEFALLQSEEYQRAAAQGIYNAVMRAFEEGY